MNITNAPEDADCRTRLVAGEEALERLAGATVMVVGLGGVGGSCTVALARGGVGSFVLVDPDVVAPSNLNRQAVAFHSTLGRNKADVARDLVLDIRPGARVETQVRKVLPADVAELLRTRPDFVVDAQDTVATKLALAKACEEQGIPLVSSMGTGNKLHPELFRIADIYETDRCPLCRVVRKRARQMGIDALTVLYSQEEPRLNPANAAAPGSGEHPTVGSVSFVPPAAGLMLAGHVLRTLGGF